jgi:hypothetical protein
MIRDVDLASKRGRMAQYLRESINITKKTGKANSAGQMGTNILVSLKRIKRTARES